jgi:nucleoside-diphosphate-sugar epimerase
MKILITGVHGFVGSNLVYTLHSHSIYGISTRPVNKSGSLATYSWDELEKIPSMDVVIHLAGKAHDIKDKTEAETYFSINTRLTQKIFDWFLKSEARKFIFFSSVKAVADEVCGVLMEDVLPAPKGPYGESKLKAEEYIKESLRKLNNPTEKQIYILRPCMIHGHGNKGNLNLLYNIVKKGIPWPLGSFDNQRSFISIDNVSYIINKIIEQDIPSGVYNLADDEPVSTNQIIKIMCNVMSCKYKILYIKKNIMINIAKLGDILHLPLNQERMKKLTQNFIVSNEKIKKTLSIEHLPVSAKDGLIKTFNSFN